MIGKCFYDLEMQKAEEGFPSQVKILTGFQSGDLELDEGE
jgi:hypothetical protein